MRIYWSRKSIPELATLPANVRKKNFKEARFRVQSHAAYWAGGGIFLLVVTVIFILFNRFIPQGDSVLFNMLRAVCTILPASFVWDQMTISLMRKHYSHILARSGVKPGDEGYAADRLIQAADEQERHQWRIVRRVSRPFFLAVMLVLMYALIQTAK